MTEQKLKRIELDQFSVPLKRYSPSWQEKLERIAREQWLKEQERRMIDTLKAHLMKAFVKNEKWKIFATERHIQNHLRGIHRTVYVKMGTALNWSNLDKAILAQLNSVGSQEGRFENYRKIASSVLSNEPQAIDLIIIDNCHKIIDKNIFLLLGLMLELSGVVQFIFLLPEDYIQKFIKATETYKGRMFTNFVKSRYDITA